MISGIAQSSQEQATGLDQVNSAVNQMDQVTQQNAAMVEQATAAAANLRTESVALAELVSRFHTGETAPARRRAGPSPRDGSAPPRGPRRAADAPRIQRRGRAGMGRVQGQGPKGDRVAQRLDRRDAVLPGRTGLAGQPVGGTGLQGQGPPLPAGRVSPAESASGTATAMRT